ncbi:TRAP transporter small permease subunit [Desulfofustis glycolicus]|uniref:TRAP-type mannitol/chloroaromatic compound transport system, small permease component n=1 Tax=Desulfofustis glycolicus DSM 9705 TaxID=1121409 RepID=A0A1M5XE61_9BACT|nr:TRAP transporter small permease subunit [Desulfofustis glycolicus]MCB2218533.1 TRAP transporter small permease subunit [Desulfobulbaceae bacterium]SHH98110.1 TRAP-type mannitol/chloroaromatic compound transport system, small permease component [Desulfofustis glycolicus DSM 9705]
MNHFLNFIDRLSAWVGKSFAWCILILTFATSYEVFVRYALRNPTDWAFDVSYIMYGTLFMMAGGYALSRNAHVRGDFVYRLWPPRIQAGIELVLYFIFFYPGILALIYAGTGYAIESWGYMPYGFTGPKGEISVNSPAGVPIAPLKTILPIASAILLLQGIAETIRCVLCLKNGSWPARMHDVEEMEKVLIEQHKREAAKAERELAAKREEGAQ